MEADTPRRARLPKKVLALCPPRPVRPPGVATPVLVAQVRGRPGHSRPPAMPLVAAALPPPVVAGPRGVDVADTPCRKEGARPVARPCLVRPSGRLVAPLPFPTAT